MTAGPPELPPEFMVRNTDPPDQLDALPQPEGDVEKQVRRMSRRGFLIAAGTAVAAAGTYGWMRTRPAEEGIAWPLRRILQLNGNFAAALSSNQRLSQEFSPARARMPRVNGVLGLSDDLDLDAW